MPKGVPQIGLGSRQPKADNGDQGGAGVRQVVEGVGRDGERAAENAGQQLDEEQNDIQTDADTAAQRAVTGAALLARLVGRRTDDPFGK